MLKRDYRTREEILGFFENLGVIYLSRTRIDWEPLMQMNLRKSPYYIENRKEFDYLARRYGADIDRAAIAPIYISRIDKTIGYGVFADNDIREGDFIGEYTGVVQISGKHTRCFKADSGHESDYSWYYLDKLDKAPPLEINGRLEGNEMRFVNHGQEPNLLVEHTLYRGQWVLFFIASRDIKKDEQLLISYGEAYWDEEYRDRQAI
ncbi:MAG: SET domain-containing protein-lysine N-methyltransferase [Thermodesulfobacteriota bacterium]